MTATFASKPTAIRQPEPINIDLGGLRSIESFVSRTAKPLKHYSDLYQCGATPRVIWDLRGCTPRYMNMATLTAFLSVADRLREFSGEPQKARIEYNPQIFQFWDDIHFTSVAQKLDLFDWEPKGIFGGYSWGATNPDTKIFLFDFDNAAPPRQEERAWITWKDSIRDKLRQRMLLLCGPLFKTRKGTSRLSNELSDTIANTCAELVLNASLWGHSNSFVGLQRTSDRITAAICDAGRGLNSSFSSKPIGQLQRHPKLKTAVDAIILASLINRQDFGLRRAITSVLDRNGWVMMSSAAGLVKWTSEPWSRALALFDNDSRSVPSVSKVFTTSRDREAEPNTSAGFSRLLESGIRGVRVSFEIPVQ
jgi:hypothetical protein